jgi:hypothetical protein
VQWEQAPVNFRIATKIGVMGFYIVHYKYGMVKTIVCETGHPACYIC